MIYACDAGIVGLENEGCAVNVPRRQRSRQFCRLLRIEVKRGIGTGVDINKVTACVFDSVKHHFVCNGLQPGFSCNGNVDACIDILVNTRAVAEHHRCAAFGNCKHFALLCFDVLTAVFHKPCQRLRHSDVRTCCNHRCIQLVGAHGKVVIFVFRTVGVFTYAACSGKFAAVGRHDNRVGILQRRGHVDTVRCLVHCIVFDNQQELSFGILSVVSRTCRNNFVVEISDFK